MIRIASWCLPHEKIDEILEPTGKMRPNLRHTGRVTVQHEVMVTHNGAAGLFRAIA